MKHATVVKRRGGRRGSADELHLVGHLASILSPDDLLASLDGALDDLRSFLAADDAELFVVEGEASGDLILVACRGVDEQALCSQQRFSAGCGYPGVVARHGAMIAVEDMRRDPRFLRRSVCERGVRAFAGVPLRDGRGVIGSLHVMWRQPRAMTRRELRLLERFAGPLAMALRAGIATWRQTLAACLTAAGDDPARALASALRCMQEAVTARRGTLVMGDARDGATVVVSEGEPTGLTLPCQQERRGWCSELARGHAVLAHECKRCVHVDGHCCVPLTRGAALLGTGAFDIAPPTGQPATRPLLPLLVMAQEVAARMPALRERAASFALSGPVERAREASLELHCFGSFELRLDGERVSPTVFRRKKTLQLLKLLALHAGRPLSRYALVEWLWPEVDEDSGNNRLHVTMHELRKVLEPMHRRGRWRFIETVGDAFRLRVGGGVAVDLVTFAEHIAAGRAAVRTRDATAGLSHFEQAAALYRGALLEDEPYEPWCEEPREELMRQVVEALTATAKLATELEQPERAIASLRRAVQVDAWREDLHQQLLGLLVRAGRCAEAQAHYERSRRQLRDELGVEPALHLPAGVQARSAMA